MPAANIISRATPHLDLSDDEAAALIKRASRHCRERPLRVLAPPLRARRRRGSLKEKGEPMTKDTTSPVQSIIDAFEWRAFRRQLGAYGFLGLMLAGIGAAAWVFWQAKEITASDTNTDVNEKISSLKKLINDNNLKIQNTEKSLNNASLNMLHELPTATKDDCKHIISSSYDPIVVPFSLFDQNGKLRSKPEIAQGLYQASLVQPPRDIDCISLWFSQDVQLIFNVKQLGDVKLQNWDDTAASTVSTLQSEYSKLYHQDQIYDKAMKKLLDIREQQEEAPFIGETAVQKR
jgi:hypothetical protein